MTRARDESRERSTDGALERATVARDASKGVDLRRGSEPPRDRPVRRD